MATLVSLQTSASSLVGNEPGRRGGIRLGVANVEALARNPMGMNQPPLGKPADEIAWRVGICGRRKERRQFAKRLTFEEIDRRANHSPASPRAREPASPRACAAPRRAQTIEAGSRIPNLTQTPSISARRTLRMSSAAVKVRLLTAPDARRQPSNTEADELRPPPRNSPCTTASSPRIGPTIRSPTIRLAAQA